MKKIKKEITKEVDMYVAYDGTEFYSMTDCEAYEQNNFHLLKEQLGNLIQCTYLNDIPPYDGYCHSELSNYYWYFIRDNKDLAVLNTIYQCDMPDSVINSWVCIEDYSDFDEASWYAAEDIVVGIHDVIQILMETYPSAEFKKFVASKFEDIIEE